MRKRRKAHEKAHESEKNRVNMRRKVTLTGETEVDYV